MSKQPLDYQYATRGGDPQVKWQTIVSCSNEGPIEHLAAAGIEADKAPATPRRRPSWRPPRSTPANPNRAGGCSAAPYCSGCMSAGSNPSHPLLAVTIR